MLKGLKKICNHYYLDLFFYFFKSGINSFYQKNIEVTMPHLLSKEIYLYV